MSAGGSRTSPPPSGPTAAGSRDLTAAGEDLLRQAARNPQFDVGSLDRWAEMLQILKDIAANRMPSVADLLKQAAKARTAGSKPAATGPKAGQAARRRRQAFLRRPGRQEDGNSARAAGRRQRIFVSSRRKRAARRRAPAKKPSTPSLRLPTTTLIGQAGDNPQSPQSRPATRWTRQSASSRICWSNLRRSSTS